MITAPSNWDAIYAMNDATLEVRLSWTRGGYSFNLYNADLSSGGVTIEHAICNNLSFGNVAMAMLTFTIKDYAENTNNIKSYSPNEGGTYITLSVRAKSELYYTAHRIRYTGWAELGVFIATELATQANGDVTVTAYDFMIRNDLRLANNLYGSYVTPSNLNAYVYFGTYGINGITSSSRIANVSIPSASVREKGLTSRELLGVFATFAGSNIILRRSDRTISFIDVLYLSSLYYGFSDYQTGVPATCQSISADEARTIQELIIKQGETETPTADYGEMIYYNFPDWVDAPSSAQVAIINQAVKGGYDRKIQSIEVNGVVVSPLFELGDTLSFDTSALFDKPYFNFKPWSMRINIGGLCYGDFSAKFDFASFVDKFPSTTSGLTEATLPATQTPTFNFLGDHSFTLSRIETSTRRDSFNVARFTQSSLSSFTVTYEDYNDEQHTVTIGAATLTSNNAVLSTYGSNACIENAVYITSTVLPRARDVKRVVSTSLVLYPYSSSVTNNRIRMYLG